MNVPTAVLIRNSLNSNKMTDLLNKLGITERRLNQVSLEELENVFGKNTDFEKVNKNIDFLRNESLKYLKNAIKRCE